MKKTTVCYIIALIAASVMGGACAAYGWNSHKDYIEKTKIEI